MNLFLFIDIYRRAYSEAALDNSWDDTTIILYFCIIVAISIIGKIADTRNVKVSRLWTIIASLLLIVILGLRGRNVGIDTSTYQDTFANALSPDAFKYTTTEPGYHLLQKFLRSIFSSPELAIFLYALITVSFVMNSLWRYRDNICFFIAFSFYVGIYYFQAMDLLRIYLAAAFLMWNYNCLVEKKYKKFFLLILLASTIHFSSIVMVLPLLYLWIHQKNPKIAFFLIIAAIILLIPLTSQFADYIAIARYANYGDSNESSRSVGIMLFFDYLPCFLLIYYVLRHKIEGQWTDILISLTAVGFFIRMLAYYINIAGRLSIHFMGLYLLVIPFFVNYIKLNHHRL